MDSKTDDFKIKVFKDKILLEKNKINKRLFNNLRFNSVVEDACSSLVSSIDGSFDFTISDDQKVIVIMSEGKLKKRKNSCDENIALKAITISLVGDSLVVDEAFGWLDSRASLNRMRIDLEQESSCAVSTSYKHSVFDNDGLEMTRSSFSEFLFLLNDEEYTMDTLKLRLLTSLHRPEFFSDYLPGLPVYCNNAVSSCMYRDYDNLAIVHVKKATGVCRNSFYSIEDSFCEVFNDWPHDLKVSVENPVALWDKHMGKYVTKNKYSNQTLDEATNNIKEKFAKNLENPRIKEYYPEYYSTLVFHINNPKKSKTF